MYSTVGSVGVTGREQRTEDGRGGVLVQLSKVGVGLGSCILGIGYRGIAYWVLDTVEHIYFWICLSVSLMPSPSKYTADFLQVRLIVYVSKPELCKYEVKYELCRYVLYVSMS